MDKSADNDTKIIRLDELLADQDCEGDEAFEDDWKVFERIDELMELADSAVSKKKKLEYINAALELDPENLDVLLMKHRVTSKRDIVAKEELEKLLETGRRQLEEEGCFEDCVGDF